MKEFLKEIFSQRNKGVENSTLPKDTEVETQTKMSLTDRYNTWWEQENAKAFLRQYPVYGARIFPVGQTSFYEVCFGAILDKFFLFSWKMETYPENGILQFVSRDLCIVCMRRCLWIKRYLES